LPLGQLYVSVITLAEIRFGIELVSEANRRAELNDWLTNKVRPIMLDSFTRTGAPYPSPDHRWNA
ncbi:MAG TPA: hypothetical protein VG488_08375, partial [Candidatus Angelobacter sp.]|nr:hypothetical protein [Candidatus Angelobacter sp.]